VTPNKVLIASPIRQQPEILTEFLASLNRLDLSGLEVSYFFIDDNDNPFSVKLLREFTPNYGSQGTIKTVLPNDLYTPHRWTGALIKKLAGFKERILEYARDNSYHVFLVDSDLILHPATLKQLMAADKDIVAEIYWSKLPNFIDCREITAILPQVWVGEPNNHVEHSYGERLSEAEKRYRQNNFLYRLDLPGLYEVSGVRGCIYISEAAIKSGLSYLPLENINLPSADDYFSLRAAAAGFKVYVDTHYPAYHLLNKDSLPHAAEYIKKSSSELALKITNWSNSSATPSEQRQVKTSANKLTLAILVQANSLHYLHRSLSQAARYIDNAVVLDNTGDERTAAICRETLDKIPVAIHVNTAPELSEQQLRKELWNHAANTAPDWILILDPTEILEDAASSEIRRLLEDDRWDHYAFPIYDFWNETHYREDMFWQSHQSEQILLLRYQPNFIYCWQDDSPIPERFPANIKATSGTFSHWRVKNFSWATREDRQRQFERYQNLPPGAGYEVMLKYKTLFRENPRLIRWRD
jgi:hypothetical protein